MSKWSFFICLYSRPQVTITGLYLLMGRENVAVERLPAGAVCALEFVSNSQLLSNTLCGEPIEEGLKHCVHGVEPLIRVSLEPESMEEFDNLRIALKQLSVLDPHIRVIEQENGELSMLASGSFNIISLL